MNIKMISSDRIHIQLKTILAPYKIFHNFLNNSHVLFNRENIFSTHTHKNVWTLAFTDFLDSSLGFVQASQGCSLCSFGGITSPEMRLSRYHAGRQNVDPNHLLLQIVWGSLSKSSVFMIPLTLTRFPVPPLPSYSKHRQHLYDQRALLLSYLTKGHVTSMYNFSLGCPSNFSLAWRCLFFRRGVFLGQQPHSPFPSGSLVSVFIETSVPDLDKSFTSVFAFVLGTLETSHNRFLYKFLTFFTSCICSPLCGSLQTSW